MAKPGANPRGAHLLSRISERLRETFCSPPRSAELLAALLVLIGLLGGTWLVYLTGGAQFATIHLMYLPIILAGTFFGMRGGLAAGALAALLSGPYMPLNTATGLAQEPVNWLLRMFFFCMVGGVVGMAAATLRRQLNLLDWLNDHDVDTGLLNYSGFVKSERRKFGRSGPLREKVLVVAQIKNLLDVETTFGANFGQKLVKQICDRGRELVPPDVSLALIQRDRLALVFRSQMDDQLRSSIEGRVRSPYEIDGVPVHVDFVFGAAEFPRHAASFDELFQKANIAVHTALTRNQPFHTYDSAADVRSRENLELLGMIPAAIANNQFALWHQAKIEVATGKVAGTEALLRWIHPQRGFIPPGSFIPQAEESTLIDDITKWVIGTALADKAAWTARGHVLQVAINLSVRNLHRRSLLDSLHESVTLHRIDPKEVELEITESAVMGDIEHCVRLIEQLRERGYRVSIDDFGTGHSSLAYLKMLPVTALKIDQSFVRALVNDASDQKIVRTILDLANALGLESVAEGVEDENALELLRKWGCTYAQGYALHRPTPREDLLSWVEGQPRSSAGVAA